MFKSLRSRREERGRQGSSPPDYFLLFGFRETQRVGSAVLGDFLDHTFPTGKKFFSGFLQDLLLFYFSFEKKI